MIQNANIDCLNFNTFWTNSGMQKTRSLVVETPLKVDQSIAIRIRLGSLGVLRRKYDYLLHLHWQHTLIAQK